MKTKSKKELLREIDELKALSLEQAEQANASLSQSWNVKLPFALAKSQK